MALAQALKLFETASEDSKLGGKMMQDLLDAQGRVRFRSLVAFHDHITRTYSFRLVQNNTEGVQAGGRHLFYANGHVLVRVKTNGTFRRPRPHMTVSLATGLSWPEEAGKFNKQGEVVPKIGGVNRLGDNWRALARLGPTMDAIEAHDDAWAESCHFDFVAGFDGTSAATLTLS